MSLAEEGLSSGASEEIVRRLLRAAAMGGREAGSGPPGAGFFVPGRVEMLGKHTDYAGGRSLVAAVEAGISAVVFGDDEPRILVIDTDTGEQALFRHPSGETGPGDAGTPKDGKGWRIYPESYLDRIRADLAHLGGRIEGGAVVALSSSLPRSAGMSSSTALIIALHLALATRYRWAEAATFQDHLGTRKALADYLAAVESGRAYPWPGARSGSPEDGARSGGVGTRGGGQDHLAILCAKPGHAIRFGFGPTRIEGEAPLPEGWCFALASSGVTASKADSARDAYNRLASQAEAIMDLWRGAGENPPEPHLGAIIDGRPSDLLRLGRILKESRHLRFTPSELTLRALQFVDECTLHVPGAHEALLQGDLEAFGRHAAASHESGREALLNDTPETDELTSLARRLGAPAASPFGAGFGGSVWALVPESGSAEFLDRWRSGYLLEFPHRTGSCSFFRSRAGPPALRVF